MASSEMNHYTDPVDEPGAEATLGPDIGETVAAVLKPLASLKLTVGLFLLGIFIVLAGTFAQVHDDIWEVIQTYFRFDVNKLVTASFPWINLGELFVWIDAKLFFPPSFFPNDPVFPKGFGWMKFIWPHGTPNFPEWAGIWFPKGWVIGIAMMLNLLAAHSLRFKVQARGSRLFSGLAIVGLGCVLTALIIISGSISDGLQAKPLISYTMLKYLLQTTLFGLTGVCIYGALAADREHAEQRWLFGLSAGVLAIGALFVFLWTAEDEAAMRILYQLVKATFASLILLAGCIALFKKRAGIVLLHAGIMLIMSYDVLVGVRHVESQMRIEEGQTISYSRDIREVELAVIDRSDKDQDHVTVITAPLLKAGAMISDDRLPFALHFLDYMKNSDLRSLASFEDEEEKPENPATAGFGQRFVAVNARPAAGTDSGGSVDVPSAYVTLTARDGKELGTYLVSAFPDMIPGMLPETQTVEVDGKPYDVALRYKRIYRDYQITLNDVQKNDYMGTDRPKDYSSFITVTDPGRETSFEQRIWMNNPMRYAGETYYQSNYIPAGALGRGSQEVTVLQVVSNEGWMTPYVGCMIVAVGMLFQFGLTLLRFLGRRVNYDVSAVQPIHLVEEEKIHGWTGGHAPPSSLMNAAGWIVTGVILAGVASALVTLGKAPSQKAGAFHVQSFGELPMWYKGRAMPIDTFARNSLLQLSDRETFKLDDKRQPALRWLIDLMADETKARSYPVIRIENVDVLTAIGVEQREGLTYSVDELTSHADKIIEQAQAASRVPAEQRTLYQRKILELANRIIFYNFLERSLGRAPQLPNDEKVDPHDFQGLAARAEEYFRFIRFARRSLKEFADQYKLGPLPLVVPTHLEAGERPQLAEFDTKWEPVTIADIYRQFYAEFPRPTPPAIEHFTNMLDAYAAGKTGDFNSELQKYRKLLDKHAASAEDVPLSRTDFEARYNRYGAFNLSSWLYVFAFVLAALGWLAWPQIFQRSSFWLIAAIFVIHTAALVGRIYISGRPPVTNLYSSAIFIGWAAVLGGLIIEMVTRLGIGNVLAAVAGFLTLRVADGLAADGDTFVVLEAVLDTQFWLATHVVCITLGYATTYMAGLLGALYVLLGVFTPSLDRQVAKEITRMTYGTLCFALFFSFVGTVLGGLWADDSWGRFWGWDPKENGALIIVLWNALVLHARWGAMARERGLAVLAVLGNIVVSWSWFGVNELGVGLHSYGFTEGRLLMLCLFVLSQLLIAGIGCLPKDCWWSERRLTV